MTVVDDRPSAVELSVTGVRAGDCTGPGPCDTSPLGEGKNWVTERGGLPAYIRAIAHALQRERGLDEETSIQTAIAAVKRWASGGGGVSAATRARAAEAVAHWEAMKGSSGGKRAFNPQEMRVTSGTGGGRWTASGTGGQTAANPAWVKQIDSRRTENARHTAGRSAQSLMNELAGEVGGLSAQTGHGESQSDVAKRWQEAHHLLGQNTLGANFYAEAHNVGQISQGLKTPAVAQITELAHQLAGSADWSKLSPLQQNLYMEIANVRLMKRLNPHPRKARRPARGRPVHAAAAGHRSAAQDNAAYRQGVADRLAGKAQLTAAAFREAHPDADPDDYPFYQAGFDGDSDDDNLELRPRTRMVEAIVRLEIALGTRAVAEWGGAGPPTADASGSAALLPVAQPKPPKPRQARLLGDQLRGGEHHRFQGNDLEHCTQCGRSIRAEVHRRPKVVEAGERHAGPGHDPVASGHIRGDIRRRARTAKAAHDRSAQSLEEPLTDALRRYFADQRTSTLARLNGKRGKQMLKRAGVRAANPPTGGSPAPVTPLPAGAAGAVIVPSAVSATLGSGVTAQALLAGVVTPTALAAVLGVAEAALAPSLGYRTHGELVAALLAGQVTMTAIKAAFPAQAANVHLPGPPAPATPTAMTDFGTAAPPLDVGALFDRSYWNDRLEQILKPYYDAAATHAVVNVRRHLELPPDFEDGTSLGAVRSMLAARGNQTSPRINAATYADIVAQLQAGVAAGEGIDGLASRVGSTFETADRVRARRIAQTEVQAALNGSANLYAESLPAGTVGSKRWLAHWPPTGGPDERTRDAHRLAAGQTVPLGAAFYVGGWPMQYPGDPAAPPELTVNCRCALMFLPPGGDGGNLIWSAAKQLHTQIAGQVGVKLSPAAARFVAS